MSYREVKKELQKFSNTKQAKLLQRFFKTEKGEYGEGDVFLGIKVPIQRIVAKKYQHIPITEVGKLLHSKIHEHRLVALLILMGKYKKADGDAEKKKIFDFYLANTKHINNWDLVDLSCCDIIGGYLLDKKKDVNVLYKLAKSKDLWERRISIISTAAFIRKGKFDRTLKISGLLLKDKHDLIHKAVGWMLREVGKRNQLAEERFLKKHYKQMPRTMLRYAIERFSTNKKKFYMKK